MPRPVNYLYTNHVNRSQEASETAFKTNFQNFYIKLYRSKNISTYTPLTAGFALSVFGILQTTLSSALKEEQLETPLVVLNALVITVPIVAAFVTSLSSAVQKKSNEELTKLITHGLKNGYFRSEEKDPERQDLIPLAYNAENANRIKRQLGVSL